MYWKLSGLTGSHVDPSLSDWGVGSPKAAKFAQAETMKFDISTSSPVSTWLREDDRQHFPLPADSPKIVTLSESPLNEAMLY